MNKLRNLRNIPALVRTRISAQGIKDALAALGAVTGLLIVFVAAGSLAGRGEYYTWKWAAGMEVLCAVIIGIIANVRKEDDP